MKIVILIRLKMILPATMRSCRRYEKMNCIPHEGKGRSKDKKRRTHTAVIIEMLNRVHAEARERLDISVAMVEGMNIFVKSFDMDESVGKIKVKLPIERNPEECKDEHCHVPRIGKCLLVTHER